MMIDKLRSAYLLFGILFIIPFCTCAQSTIAASGTNWLRAVYRLDYRLDSTVATPKSEQMILRINDGASCFRSKAEYIHDSVYANLNQLSQNARTKAANDAARKAGKTELFYSIFKEPAQGLVFYHDNIGSVDYQYQENTSLFNWKITLAKKMVSGYECQQAFTTFGGRTWEAWFTRDIPVSEGPYKFYGLPGLILRVRDMHNNYVFELLSFESSPKPFAISITSSAPLVSKAKFIQAKHNDDLTFLDRMAVAGNKFPEEMRRSHFERLKRQNNPLELK